MSVLPELNQKSLRRDSSELFLHDSRSWFLVFETRLAVTSGVGVSAMLIACLGWGSLVWDSRDLPVRGSWFTDGPFLPIEFARKSSDGRMTLVIMPTTFPLVRSLWTPISAVNLAAARKALGTRECPGLVKPETCVDYWCHGSRNRYVARQIGRWARGLQVDAVIWTNLPPRFGGEDKTIPSAKEVVTYLRGLSGQDREQAKHYIRMAPKQIDTNYRRAIENALRWSCLSPI